MSDSSRTHPVVTTLTEAYRALGCANKSGLLAVSGGADSLALLLGTTEVGADLCISVAVASLDHGLRPESRGEVEFIRSLCERLRVPFYTRTLNIAAGAGVEERSRIERYRALEEFRVSLGHDFIATAHTSNDQAETVLMRLARGSALRGASGILPRRGAIVRPLLRVPRSEVEDYLASKHLAPVRDAMNTDRTFFRSRIRLDVLPALERAAETDVVEKLAAFAEAASEDDDFLRQIASLAFERLSLGEGVLDGVGFRALPRPIQLRVLVALLESKELVADRLVLEQALRALQIGGKATLPRGLLLESAGDRIRCSSQALPRTNYSVLLDQNGNWQSVVPAGLRMRVISRPEGSLKTCLPPDIRFPLTVRTRLAGDRLIEPQGFSRKLQDWLVDHRIPVEFRDLLPIVVDSLGRIIWLPGLWSASTAWGGERHWLQAEPLEGPDGPKLPLFLAHKGT